MENLLKVAKQILREINENGTVQENWKIGMKVAVGYMFDEVYNRLKKDYIERAESSNRIGDVDYDIEFDIEIGFNRYSSIEKQFESINNYFTSLNEIK